MDFNILSLAQEEQLSYSEKDIYYKKLDQFIKYRKLTNTTKGALLMAPKLKKITNKIAFKLTKIFCSKNIEISSGGIENIPKTTCLFAHTHQGLLDNFAWIPTCPKHCIIFHSEKCNILLKIAQLNTGLVLVNKEDKKNRLNAKFDCIKLLREFERKNISRNEYDRFLERSKNQLRIAGIDIDVERRHIWGFENDFYRYFPINNV